MDRHEEPTAPRRSEQDTESASPASAAEPRRAVGHEPTWGERLVQEYAAPHRIALYDVGAGMPYCGLIVPAPSGYLWHQQVGGMLCTHRDLEGIYLPIPDHDLGQNLESLHVGCCTYTLDDWEASEAYRAAHPAGVAASDAWTREHMPELAAIQDALATADRPLGMDADEADQLNDLLRAARLPLSVVRDRLERSTEAWVWVRIAGDVAAWEHEYAYARAPKDEASVPRPPTGYRFQWMLAALAGTEVVLTWENCD